MAMGTWVVEILLRGAKPKNYCEPSYILGIIENHRIFSDLQADTSCATTIMHICDEISDVRLSVINFQLTGLGDA